MSDMKCPFCGKELQEDVGYDGDYSCPNCTEPYFGSPELWQELIRTRKALETIRKEMSNEYMPDYAVIRDALKTALEQKDVK